MVTLRRPGLRSLVAVGTLALLVATHRPVQDAQALGGLNTLTVSPSHGRAGSTFQLTYAISPCTAAAGLTIGFSSSAFPPSGPMLETAPTESSCHATLTATPPLNAAHQPPAPGPGSAANALLGKSLVRGGTPREDHSSSHACRSGMPEPSPV